LLLFESTFTSFSKIKSTYLRLMDPNPRGPETCGSGFLLQCGTGPSLINPDPVLSHAFKLQKAKLLSKT
jgi:hypothetical protein